MVIRGQMFLGWSNLQYLRHGPRKTDGDYGPHAQLTGKAMLGEIYFAHPLEVPEHVGGPNNFFA